MAEKRKRAQNFSTEEKDKLLSLLVLYKDTILNKKTDCSTNEAKTVAWIEVTNAFNATSKIFRTKDSLIKMWEKMKSQSKIYYTSRNDGEIKIDPIMEHVCTLLGHACTGTVGVTDSNGEVDIIMENELTICERSVYDLKRQLLEEEIEFKRKLHELQLRAAATEVEIKAEILKQIKGDLTLL